MVGAPPTRHLESRTSPLRAPPAKEPQGAVKLFAKIGAFTEARRLEALSLYPYFKPIYQPERRIRVFTSAVSNHGQLCALFDQIDGASFPVNVTELPSRSECIMENVEAVLAESNIHVQRARLNHPGGGCAYRIEENGASCAFITDNELYPPQQGATSYAGWVEF